MHFGKSRERSLQCGIEYGDRSSKTLNHRIELEPESDWGRSSFRRGGVRSRLWRVGSDRTPSISTY
ncbi:MAG: hypothetical protein AB4042_05045 [Leptolyngbyaceae cyanobacterium]